MKVKKLQLKNGYTIPALGFGTWELKGDTAKESVLYALELGYRHIDTADVYGNHKEVAKAMNESGLSREDIYLTTKIFRNNLAKDDVVSAGKRFLDELDIPYIDLLLIHWPSHSIPIVETLEGFQQLIDEGITKSIGVSNFMVSHLNDAMKKSDVEFVVNQIEYHPSLKQDDVVELCEDNDVVVTAYSPLGKGQDLKIDIIKDLAKKYNKPESQVIINWILSKGMVVIPRSSKAEHIEENFNSISWELDEEDVQKIDQIKSDNRIVG